MLLYGTIVIKHPAYKYTFSILYFCKFVPYCNFELFFTVAGSGSKDGKGSKDNNSPSGPYAGKLHNYFFARCNISNIKL